LAANGVGIERHQQIITGLPQLLHRDGWRALDQPPLVVLQDGPENGGGDAVGHLELAALVRLRELQIRAEHAPQHGVGVGGEERRVDHEPRVVHDEGDAVVADDRAGGGGAGRLVLRGGQHVAASGNGSLKCVDQVDRLLPIARSIVTLLRRSYRVAPVR
jgi:hypothetical protein